MGPEPAARLLLPLMATSARQPSVQLPFTAIDEVDTYLDRPGEPNNIHLELSFPDRVDEDRLRPAVAAALAIHPLARARRVRPGLLDRHLLWEIPAEPELDPVSVVSWTDPAQLSDVRAAFLAVAPPLDSSPRLRVLLACGPEHDVVLLNAHHAGLDGVSCLRLAYSIARSYSGDPDPLPALDPLSVRTPPSAVDGEAPCPNGSTRARWRARVPHRPARIEAREAGGGPGYGFTLLRLSRDRTADLCRARAGGQTVNDILLAALCLAIDRWNRSGATTRRRIQVTMPVNARSPQLRGEILGNFCRLVTIATGPDDRPGPGERPDRLLDRISEQTRQGRVPAGSPVFAAGLGLASAFLPVAVKAPLMASAQRLARGLIDTSLLSNLGRVDEPPRFGEAGVADSMWFSPAARMPRGLTVGAVTTGGRLHLCFRYRHALLGPAAAEAFGHDYDRALQALSVVG